MKKIQRPRVEDIHTGEQFKIVDIGSFEVNHALNEPSVIDFRIFDTERNKFAFPMLKEYNFIIYNNEYYLTYLHEEDSSNIKDGVAIHISSLLKKKRVHDEYTGLYNLNDVLKISLDGSGFTFINCSTKNMKLQFENFGKDDRLSMLQHLLKRFDVECYFSKYTVYIFDKVGTETDYQFRFGYNIKALNKKVDVTDCNFSVRVLGHKPTEEEGGGDQFMYYYESPLKYHMPREIQDWEAPEIEDDKIKHVETARERGIAAVQDTPIITIMVAHEELPNEKERVPGIGDRALVRHYKMKLDFDLRIIKIREHPYSNKSNEYEFSNKREDVIDRNANKNEEKFDLDLLMKQIKEINMKIMNFVTTATLDGKFDEAEKSQYEQLLKTKNELETKAKDLADNALSSANSYTDVAKQNAIEIAKAEAQQKAKEAQEAATAYAKAQTELAQKEAAAYADGVVTASEKAVLDQAEQKVSDAKKYAEQKAKEAETAANNATNTKIDGLTFGANNLITGTQNKNANGWKSWGNIGRVGVYGPIGTAKQCLYIETKSADGKTNLTVPQGTAIGLQGDGHTFSVKAGQEYTLSMQIATSELGDKLSYTHLMYSVTGGNRRLQEIKITDFTKTEPIYVGATTYYYKINFTFKADRDDNNVHLLIGGVTARELNGSNGYAWIRIYELQVVPGNKVYEYSVSPADIQEDITQKAKETQDAAALDASTKATAATQNAKNDVQNGKVPLPTTSLNGDINPDKNKIKNAHMTLDENGCLLDQGNFRLIDPETGNEEIVRSDTNMIYDHSFEMLQFDPRQNLRGKLYKYTGPRHEIDTQYGARPGVWYCEGDPTVQWVGYTPGIEGINFAAYGDMFVEVNTKAQWSQYTYLNFDNSLKKRYTMSAALCHGDVDWDGAAKIRLRILAYDKSFKYISHVGQRDVDIPVTMVKKWKRYSVTTNTDLPEGTVFLRCIIESLQAWAWADGVQLVPYDKPIVYNPENSLYALRNRGLETKIVTTNCIKFSGGNPYMVDNGVMWWGTGEQGWGFYGRGNNQWWKFANG
ncbi:phage tail protein [Bacillus sp. NPDC077411]|uniref:phage tail protein n=1 Tax=Bacillus sp. NPDC077411 TaxID=3363947 RepID=UPI0037CC1F66